MKIGASYYPELSNPEVWRADLTTARATGLSVLRCGEFAWSRFAPDANEWHDDWAREFLDLAHSLGFQVVWCSPSATPPPYVFDRWPDLFAVTCDNVPMPAGIRRHYCPSHRAYRDHSASDTARIARAINNHPAVIGWQIDNEIAGDRFTCWCERCRAVFQQWLEQRYGSLTALNAAWQTDVWSQRYTSWSQIHIPHKHFAASHTPALRLAWRRFRSDNWLAFYRAQYDALKNAGVTTPVTTNFYDITWDMPFNQWDWRPYLDVMGCSFYEPNEATGRFEMALLRGLDLKRLWVLEQKAGQQIAQNLYPETLARLEKHLRICAENGAEFGTYWHLRQHQAGCEMEHGAVLRHDGKPTRIAAAVHTAYENTKNIPAIIPSADRALVFDFNQQWAQESRPHPGASWDYRQRIDSEWLGAAYDLWGGVRVGPLVESLKTANLVLAPHFQMAAEPHYLALADFFKRGGTLVTTADFGRLDWENNVRPIPPLGGLAPLGVSVPDGEMLHLADQFTVSGKLGAKEVRGQYFWWVPDDGVRTLQPAVTLADGDAAGPAWVDFNVSAGKVRVLTTAFNRESLAALLANLE